MIPPIIVIGDFFNDNNRQYHFMVDERIYTHIHIYLHIYIYTFIHVCIAVENTNVSQASQSLISLLAVSSRSCFMIHAGILSWCTAGWCELTIIWQCVAEHAECTCSCHGLCSKIWNPSRIEVETLWVSILKKHIKFGNKFDCVEGVGPSFPFDQNNRAEI